MIYIRDSRVGEISLQWLDNSYFYLQWGKSSISSLRRRYQKENWYNKLHETETGHQILGPTALVDWK